MVMTKPRRPRVAGFILCTLGAALPLFSSATHHHEPDHDHHHERSEELECVICAAVAIPGIPVSGVSAVPEPSLLKVPFRSEERFVGLARLAASPAARAPPSHSF